MSTQQQIDDPGQWRVGDMFEGEHDGHPFSGPIWALGMDLYVGGLVVRHGAQWVPSDKTGHVTRTVEPIPEPTVPWALVRFADGAVLMRHAYTQEWIDTDGQLISWLDAQSFYGAPVAVSLPRWSDEVDGLRARVEKLAAQWERAADGHAHTNGVSERPCETFARAAAARTLRALLAEGGEA